MSTVYIPLNSTVYEFNPYDFGSWDTELATFIEMEYVGTNLFDGQPLNSTACVKGFENVSCQPRRAYHARPGLHKGTAQPDAVHSLAVPLMPCLPLLPAQFGFVIGTSSSLFNAIVQTANATLIGLGDGKGVVEGLLDNLLSDIGANLRDSEDDLAIYPNPFYGINPGNFPRWNDDSLQLVDGGEAGAK